VRDTDHRDGGDENTGGCSMFVGIEICITVKPIPAAILSLYKLYGVAVHTRPIGMLSY
jgi:hypothetical protein